MFASLFLCFLLYTYSYSHDNFFTSVFFNRIFLCCYRDAVCLFLYIFRYYQFEYLVLFFLVEVMLSCGIPSIQVRPTIHLLSRFLSFSIYSPSLFSSCFLFWHGYSSIRTILQFSTTNLSNDFIKLRWCFLGFVLFEFMLDFPERSVRHDTHKSRSVHT